MDVYWNLKQVRKSFHEKAGQCHVGFFFFSFVVELGVPLDENAFVLIEGHPKCRTVTPS